MKSAEVSTVQFSSCDMNEAYLLFSRHVGAYGKLDVTICRRTPQTNAAATASGRLCCRACWPPTDLIVFRRRTMLKRCAAIRPRALLGYDRTRLEAWFTKYLTTILRQSYDYLTIMRKLRSTYDECLIYKTSYKGRKAFLRYDSLAKL